MTAPADLVSTLKSRFASATPRASLDWPAVNLAPSEVIAALTFLRDAAGYDFLVDITGVDWGLEASPRFTVVWHLYGSEHHGYARVAADCADDAVPTMPTTTGLWPAADWHERECWDLMGIAFEGHPDLRRILMWDGYPHHPLRKEFPLAGIETELPDLEVAAETAAKVAPAPMMGGPFVATPGTMNLTEAEPRAKDESWNEQQEKPE
jgi:NADH-quinone oxidoreductase subunit C